MVVYGTGTAESRIVKDFDSRKTGDRGLGVGCETKTILNFEF